MKTFRKHLPFLLLKQIDEKIYTVKDYYGKISIYVNKAFLLIPSSNVVFFSIHQHNLHTICFPV